jgi:hypothetical protein
MANLGSISKEYLGNRYRVHIKLVDFSSRLCVHIIQDTFGENVLFCAPCAKVRPTGTKLHRLEWRFIPVYRDAWVVLAIYVLMKSEGSIYEREIGCIFVIQKVPLYKAWK